MADETATTIPAQPETTITELTGEKREEAPARGDISAVALGRMLGLAGASELKLMETKIDLLSTRVNALTVRMDKVLTAVSKVPTAVDLERIDVQIGSLKTVVRDAVQDITAMIGAPGASSKRRADGAEGKEE